MQDVRGLCLRSLCETLNKGAYSNLQLKNSLNSSELSSKDKALYKQLYFGTLERLITLDTIIDAHSKMKLKKMSPQLINLLRLGVFQLLYCDRIPDSIAINKTVELAKKKVGQAAGFVNAVLRNILRNKESLEGLLKSPQEKYSVGESVCNMLINAYGEKKAFEFMEGLFINIPVTAVINTLKTEGETLCALLKEQEIEAEQNGNTLTLFAHTSIESSPAYKEGLFHLQGLCSQRAVELLDIKPGMTVIDMCSSPGAKSFTAAYKMENKGSIFAFDLYPHRVELIKKGAQRLGITVINAMPCDSSKELPVKLKADRIICDVPCSGIGMMSKRPEIRYKNIDDTNELCDLQYAILCNGVKYLKEDGRLLYSTCTLNPKENSEITDKFLFEHPEFYYIEEPCTYMETGEEGFFTAVLGRRQK